MKTKSTYFGFQMGKYKKIFNMVLVPYIYIIFKVIFPCLVYYAVFWHIALSVNDNLGGSLDNMLMRKR